MSDAPRKPQPPTSRAGAAADRLRRLRLDPTALPIAIAGLVLVGTVVWLLTRPVTRPEPLVAPARVETLEQRLAEMEGQLRTLGAEQRSAVDAQRSGVDAQRAAIEAQLQALRAEQQAARGALEGRIAAVEGVPERLQQLSALEPALRQLEGVPERMRQMGALEERLRALESRPLPPDLTPMREQLAANVARIGSIEQRQANTEQGLRDLAARPVLDPAALAPVSSRLDRLADRAEAEARTTQERGAETARRIEELARTGTARDGQIEQRLGTAEEQLRSRVQALEGTLGQRLGSVEEQLGARIAALEAAQQRLTALEARAARLAALDAARTALAAGRPLGEALREVREPPPALSRFANAAPPTEAGLRLSFEEHARAAQAASEPAREGQGVLDSAVSRLSGLVTVRRGEDLVWGDAASAEIERARRALEAGDLEGALARLSRLSPPAQQAMRPWTEQAEALLAARAALRQMAAG